MTQNLKIINKTLTSADSNVSTQFILPKSSTSWSAPNPTFSNEIDAYIDNNGGYYSWNAATAGTGVSVINNEQNAQSSICPKGWKLPSENEATKFKDAYNGQTQQITTYPANFTVSGMFVTNQVSNKGYWFRYWTGTGSSNCKAGKNLCGSSSSFGISCDYPTYGQTIRCISLQD